MTNEEAKILKDGDVLVRLVNKGQSEIGYHAVVFTETYRGTEYKRIKHQNGSVDNIFPPYWDLVSKHPAKKTGFAKFIRFVEGKV